MMGRGQSVIVAGALAFCLIAGSSPRLIGDGREYLAQAVHFASLHGPAFRPADIASLQSEIARIEPSLGDWDLRASTVADSTRGRVFLHFWFYALLVAPFVWIAHVLGVSPLFAFTTVNLVLLGIAVWVALPRLGVAGAVLVFTGPIIWWIDKAHTEIFTFALLTITFALLKERPWWSMIAAGVASTQNPPIAVVIPLVLVAAFSRDRRALADRRVAAGALVGIAFALLHPAYTYVHHGTVSLLLAQTRTGVPTLQSLAAVLFDPTLGLIGNFPIFLVVVTLGVIVLARRAPRAVVSDAMLVAAITAVVFLISFSRTTNLHHGGTPSISRYALWLVPLAIPLLSNLNADNRRAWPRFLRGAAVISALVSVVAFHPSVPQNSREPTWLATFLWTRLPAWNNPLPEVFIETELHVDEPMIPVATAGCEKILIAGDDSQNGMWPSPCYPAPVPPSCQSPGALCYANLAGRRYDFVPVRGETIGPPALRRDAVWPPESVPHVQRLYDAWNWPALRSHAASPAVLRAAQNVSVESIGSDDQFILVLRNPAPGAVIRLRPAAPLRTVLVDAFTGDTLRAERYDGQQEDLVVIDLPDRFKMLLFAAQAASPR
jgi:hypothetical protein